MATKSTAIDKDRVPYLGKKNQIPCDSLVSFGNLMRGFQIKKLSLRISLHKYTTVDLIAMDIFPRPSLSSWVVEHCGGQWKKEEIDKTYHFGSVVWEGCD